MASSGCAATTRRLRRSLGSCPCGDMSVREVVERHDQVAALFGDDFSFNRAGTQAPLHEGSASRSGLANHLETESAL